MTQPVFTSNIDVELIDSMASDAAVARAARVSTVGALFPDEGADRPVPDLDADRGLIGFLMKNRHGSPFEHATFTFVVQAPIFVFRELMRHRMASYNEESGRYKELSPRFYLPASDRPLKQVGKAGAYEFVEAPDLVASTQFAISNACAVAYEHYRAMLAGGVAREVARMVLPVTIFSSAYVTINARSLMNLLSLRTKDPSATYPSFPQYEIEVMARQMEVYFYRLMPVTYHAFNAAGRVAP